MFYNNYVALDITNSDIRVVSVSYNKIRKWTSTPVPEGAIKDGIILEPHTIGVIIDNVFKSLKLNRNRVICTVTGLPFIYRLIGMPKEPQEVPSEAIERAARQEMSLNQEDMYLLWQSTKANIGKDETDYFVVGVPKTSLKPLLETMALAKIRPYLGDVKPLALARAAATSEALIVSLERDYYDIVVVTDGLVRVMHSVNPNKPKNLLEVVNELVDGLNKAIKSLNRDFPENSLKTESPLLLTGELASDPEVLKLMQEATGHPVNILKTALEMPPDMPAALYASTIGLVMKILGIKQETSQYHDVDINLLLKVQKAGQTKQNLVYAGMIILILLMAALVYKSNDLKIQAIERTDELQALLNKNNQTQVNSQKAYVQAVATKNTNNEKLQALTNELNAYIKEHQQISGSKIDYYTPVKTINESLPPGAYYRTIQLQPTGAVIQGQVMDPVDVIVFTKALERTPIFDSAIPNNISPVEDSNEATFTVTVKK
jgi:hypothetical protein